MAVSLNLNRLCQESFFEECLDPPESNNTSIGREKVKILKIESKPN